MQHNRQEYEEFYKGLETLEASLYPKTCNTCGKAYNTPEDFLLETQSLNNHKLKVCEEDDGSTIIEIFRNCTCGSTLLSNFGDRRDLTETGIQRRKQFDELLEFLVSKGHSEKSARIELINFTNGDHTNIKLKQI